VEPRDSSRLLVVHRDTGAFEHRIFRDVIEYLRPGDLLVANQSRVLPARLMGVKEGTGGQVELLLLSARGDVGPNCWEALVRPGKRIHSGQRLSFGDGALLADVLEPTEAGGRVVRLIAREGTVAEAVARVGVTPLPPYIHEQLADAERYQTVYAREPGSAAAPTAGLHFTTELLQRVEAMGVGVTYVTLHIGLDTFRPVEKDDLTDHVMHSEEIELTAETAERINATRASGGRIFAVGTTSVRTLEAVAQITASEGAADPTRIVQPYFGRTRLFITPGYQFRAVDAMITNFHLPRSTLLALVSAFAGRELILRAYHEAIEREYRFYSFGDAMLLL
ncbi:MAG TPA: tRNA preQ1(34) S-adenosylmethionine ribosyltransferase-isomerase QueA, partial [Ktedonobacterales bacterium]|nr:tRNA preQ1(34) S-adenosylmethionine ribosyltransferase-isomerase QueA [Ktedonobacterales bacterium]